MSYEGSNKVVAEYNKLANVQSINAELYHNNKKLSHSLSPNKWEFGSEDIEALTSSWEAVSHIKADKIIDEDVYIFLFNKNKQWGSNFFHFHFHELQRLLGFIELKKTQKNIKLAIPLDIKEFQRNIITKLIGDTEIIELDIFKYSYLFKNCFVGNYSNISELPLELFELFQSIGRELVSSISKVTEPKKRLLFVGRKMKTGFAGDARLMINQNEFSEFINSEGFETIFFEDYDLTGKLTALLFPKPLVIVLEIGSGLTNLLFTPKELLADTHLFIIDQSNWRLAPSRISSILRCLGVKYKVITAESQTKDHSDFQNNPFLLNLEDFKKELFSEIGNV